MDRLFPWPGDRPWNFVLHDGHHLRLDLHLYERTGTGRVHFGSVLAGHSFAEDDLHGSGVVAGRPVRCEAPAAALRWRQGYPPRPADRHDVPLLCARYGFALPAEYADGA